MFDKILIANRGEIACRIAASARRLGVASVAVYSDADARAAHVAACDQALAIGPAPATQSYLNGARLVEAALASGAQAIHPGYGFLSENADFAQACADVGLVFIGPPAAAIRAMGSKSAARQLMTEAGVPLVPGYHGAAQEVEVLRREADAIGYPVLLKASAGGGGKGMRVVASGVEFAAALEGCRREAAASFGDARILIEKYLEHARHVEIQIFADSLGNMVHLFERDCSVQRRHQKVLEEAPAPDMTAALREAMGQAALAAARAVGYVGAGTVEFLLGDDGNFYFMEMNTRLQVEHPVTEMVSGVDLVAWQLRIAAGQPLPCTQEELRQDGHAIEVRIYAENPAQDFLPATGTIRHLAWPPALHFDNGSTSPTQETSAWRVRIDSGIRQGDTVTPYYDPMLAKLIVWGRDRQQALAGMRAALAQCQVAGVATNIAFLQRLLDHPGLRQGRYDTGLIAREQARLLAPPDPPRPEMLALAAALLLHQEGHADHDPWSERSGWRLGGRQVRQLRFAGHGQDHVLRVEYRQHGWLLGGAQALELLEVLECVAPRVRIALAGRVLQGTVVREDAERLHVFFDGAQAQLSFLDPLAHPGETEHASGGLQAPMPGKVVALLAQVGQLVEKGAPLVVMEAMKMEHTVSAPARGTVAAIFYQPGEQVAEGEPLLEFSAHAPDEK